MTVYNKGTVPKYQNTT